MIKSQKQSQIGLAILILIAICYISLQYYSDYKRKDDYRVAIASELKSGLWFIEEVLKEDVHVAQKSTDQVFESYLEVDIDLNENQLLDFQTSITSAFKEIQPASDYLKNETWQSAKQSGVLPLFSDYELNKLNHAYNQRIALIAIEKQMESVGFVSPFYDDIFGKECSQRRLASIYHNKYKALFIMSSSVARKTSDAYYAALKELDPEHEYLKRLDSTARQ